MPRSVALDHNFPEPVLASVQQWLKGVDFHHLRNLGPDLAELQDHDLIYALKDIGLAVLVTHNWKMEEDARVLVALHLTRLTLVTLRKSGDDMIFATGVLLRDIVPVLRKDVPKGQLFRVRPSQVQPTPVRTALARLAERQGTTADGLISAHRQ